MLKHSSLNMYIFLYIKKIVVSLFVLLTTHGRLLSQ
jgi:hypothetical protein